MSDNSSAAHAQPHRRKTICLADDLHRGAVRSDREPVSTQAKEVMHIDEIRPRKDHRGVDLISDALPFGGLWYGEPNAAANAVSYAKFYSRSHDAVTRVYDEAGNVVEKCEHAGE